MTGTAERPRWLLHAATGAGAALLVAAALAGFAGLRDPDPDSGRRPAASPTATVSPTSAESTAVSGPGLLTAVPDPCALVPAATFAQLGLRAAAAESGRDRRASDGADTAYCEGTGGRGGAGAEDDRRSLRVAAVLHGTREEASDAMEFDRGVTRSLANTATKGSADGAETRTGPYREIAGIGGEAFAQRTDEPGWSSTTVWARHENVTLKIVYGAAVPDPTPAAEAVAGRAVAALAG
ncbi:hypothetical protein [Actinomadura sediminis]|uniref:DUF3558 domain-containing protein n=1 Tax=Actinomadura sediminis TaxID=1038904 RepID=A0ABW3EUH9_9ACTN